MAPPVACIKQGMGTKTVPLPMFQEDGAWDEGKITPRIVQRMITAVAFAARVRPHETSSVREAVHVHHHHRNACAAGDTGRG